MASRTREASLSVGGMFDNKRCGNGGRGRLAMASGSDCMRLNEMSSRSSFDSALRDEDLGLFATFLLSDPDLSIDWLAVVLLQV